MARCLRLACLALVALCVPRALASEAAENGERASNAPSKPLAASGDANISLANALWREEGETPWSPAARGGATPGGTQARAASAEREGGLEGGRLEASVRGDALATGTSLVIERAVRFVRGSS